MSILIFHIFENLKIKKYFGIPSSLDADIRKAERELDWKPKIGVEQGILMLFEWVQEN